MLVMFVTRLTRTGLTLFAVVLFTFVLGRLSGDPSRLMLGLDASDEQVAAFRAAQGLDQPLPIQLFTYFRHLLSGDLGLTVTSGSPRPVTEVIAERLPATLALGGPALVLSIFFGVLLGTAAAYYRNRWFDRLILTLSMIGQSLPSFFVGILLILVFGVGLGWLPTFGQGSPSHSILPTITLLVFPLAFIIRITRASMLDVLSAPYLRTARAKGMREWRVVWIHAFRNAMIPVITVIGLQVAGILSGAAIVETVFGWPGIGSLAVASINGRNFPVIQGLVLLTATAFSITNTIVDFVYLLIDPRIRNG